jgi:ribulose-5-phosphate 4-epimerase/fuculose-1-phosphate aldolase
VVGVACVAEGPVPASSGMRPLRRIARIGCGQARGPCPRPVAYRPPGAVSLPAPILLEHRIVDTPTPGIAGSRLNRVAPDPDVVFDRSVGETYIRYAQMLNQRGYVQSSLGNMVIRVPHPKYPEGLCYVKPQGLSLEEACVDDLVITDVPYGELLHGDRATTVGHQMNREILRLRPDVGCVIHLHHDETIAFLAAGFEEIRSTSLTFSYLMQKPAHYLPAHLNVEEDVDPIKTFIQDTNCVIMRRHGFTVLGRTVSEAYHRTNVLVSEVKRNIIVETLSAVRGTRAEYLSRADMQWMFERGDAVVYPEAKRGGAQ